MAYFKLKKDFIDMKENEVVEVEDTKIKEGVGALVVTTAGITIPSKMLELTASPAAVVLKAALKSALKGKVSSVSATMSGDDKNTLRDVLARGGSFKDISGIGGAVEPPKSIKLKKNQILLSTLTGGALPASGIDHIIDIFKKSHFPKEVRCDIPELNEHWHWHPDVLETIILGHQDNETTLLVGWPGVGKSDGLRQYAAVIKQPFMRIGCRGDMESSSLLGYPWVIKGEMEFKKGLLPQGLEGNYMICIDEVMKMPAPIAMVCQELWESNSRRLVLDEMPGSKAERTITPGPDSRLFCTDNVCGSGDNFEKFGATQIQDTSSLDRYGYTERVPYLPREVEENLLKKMYPKIADRVIRDMVALSNLVRAAYEKGGLSVTLSMRGLQAMCRLIEIRGFDLKTAVNKCYRHKLGTETEIQVLDQSLNTVGI